RFAEGSAGRSVRRCAAALSSAGRPRRHLQRGPGPAGQRRNIQKQDRGTARLRFGPYAVERRATPAAAVAHRRAAGCRPTECCPQSWCRSTTWDEGAGSMSEADLATPVQPKKPGPRRRWLLVAGLAALPVLALVAIHFYIDHLAELNLQEALAEA